MGSRGKTHCLESPAGARGSAAACREQGPPLLPSNTAVQSTERHGGELNRADMQAAGRRNKTQRDGRTLGYRAEGGRVTGTAGRWWGQGQGPASVEQSSVG